MSLALTLANPYGIVMSADRRLTTTVINGKTGERESFVLMEYEQKIFATKAGHGITYTGAATLKNGQSTACVIRRTLLQLNDDISIEEELLRVQKTLKMFSNGRNVILIGAAIDKGHNQVFSISLKTNLLTNHINKEGNCLAFSGESDIVMKLTDMLPVARDEFPLQEVIEYLRFLTRSVAGIQHYAQTIQTVSEECDVLVIQDTGARWITSPETLS